MPGNDDYCFRVDDPEDDPEEYDEYYENESSRTKALKEKYNEQRTKLLSREIADQTEKLARMTNPALQEAWEQYQIVLNLTRES